MLSNASFVAGIMSTANDMARWMHMLLNDGNINGTQVVDPDVITATWSPANVNHHNDDDDDIQRPRSVLAMFILSESEPRSTAKLFRMHEAHKALTTRCSASSAQLPSSHLLQAFKRT